jgi:hypothetical protein
MFDTASVDLREDSGKNDFRGYVLRSGFSLALRWCGFLLGLRFVYALLERLHQVTDLSMLWLLWCLNRDLLTFALHIPSALS